MLEHLYIPRPGDREIVVNYYQEFLKLSDDEIIKTCEDAKKVGIVGAHQQGLRLIALWNASRKRGLEVDLKVIDNCLITFEKQ